MYYTHCDEVNEGDNVIIGLGDSFTQGLGAYSIETWKSIPQNPATYNISGQNFLEEQGQNSWVRQLAKLLNYKTYNLGINGGGNRAAVREMFLNRLPNNMGNVIVILMATGLERYDFIKQSDATAGINWHQKWQTIWPVISDRGPISKLEKEYMDQIWSARNDAIEFLFNVNDAKNYCKARGYKFLFCSAFDTAINKPEILKFLDNKKTLIDLIDWDDFIEPESYNTLMNMLNILEGNKSATMHELFQICGKMKVPSKYLTPCTHWTIDGQKVVAEYLHNEIKKRGLV
jgi:hypothetical protein